MTETHTPASVLSTDELRVAQQLVAGALNPAIAQKLGMSEAEVTGHLDRIGKLTWARTRHTRAHSVLAAGLVPPPLVRAPAPDLSEAEQLLLLALAVCETWEGTAAAAGLDLRTVKPAMRALLARTGADSRTHLVGLAHGWNLLGDSGLGGGSGR